MDCNGCQDLIPLYALDDSDDPELQEVRAHLQTGCPVCHGRLAEAQAMLALLPLSLPAVKVPEGARARLLDRMRLRSSEKSTLQRRGSPQSATKTTRPVLWLMPAAAGAAVAACVTVLIYSHVNAKLRNSLDDIREQVINRDAQIDQLRTAQFEAAREMIRLIKAPSSVKMAHLNGQGAQPNAKATLVWDPMHKMIVFDAEDLQNLKQGRAYELWLINSGKNAIPAGVFSVDSQGRGAFMSMLSTDPGQIVQGAVSEEVASGVANPTVTNILLSGKTE